jgi:hypothetical protein
MRKEEVSLPTKKKDKKMLTIFLMILPSLLIAMTSAISELVVRLGFQIVLLMFQSVIFKNLLDDYYGE